MAEEHSLSWRLKLEKLPRLAMGDVQPTTLKEFLKAASDSILKAFKKDVPIKYLVRAQARAVDQVLYHIWTTLIAGKRAQWSLVAVGGYGRSELHPFSDIDLLLLIDEKPYKADKELISQLITCIWDTGLELGHSVRTVDECVTEGKADISVATNLMEARLLAGSPLLFDHMKYVTSSAKIWSGKTFYEAKIAEQKIRHKKYHGSSYSLEPNLKESPGGLRDIQVVGWVAKRHFQVSRLGSLVTFGFLSRSEFETLKSCLFFLWRVRFALHHVVARAEDRLLFDHQGAVAEFLGMGKATDKAASEKLMKEYYRKVLRIRELNDVLLQLFNEAILETDKDIPIAPLSDDFQARGDLIEVTHKDVFKNEPSNILRLFVHIADDSNLKGIRAKTVRYLRSALPLIDDNFRSDSINKELFLSILSQHQGIKYAFVLLKRYGVLKRYLPVYEKIVGQMQFDLFHAYTVDEHTLFLMKNIARFSQDYYSQEKQQQEFPICSNIISTMKRPELIYIAALFHDIAKGRGGDHSELGAIEAKTFCLQHGLRIEDAELVSWLVLQHLQMSMTAQRKDLSDPEVIARFAATVQEVPRLDLLYILTVADIRATNPTLWNGWKDALLKELYLSTKNWLKSPEKRLLNRSEFAIQNKKEAASMLKGREIPDSVLENLSQRTDSSYFQKYSANQVAWHCEMLHLLEADDKPVNHSMIKIRRHQNDGASEVFIYTLDRKGLFSDICQILYEQQLNIVRATIHTLADGFCIDTFVVLELDGSAINSSRRNQLIATQLSERLNYSDTLLTPLKPLRKHRHFDIDTQFSFQKTASRNLLELELISLDQPGLLARVGRLFNQMKIRLHGAKIATFGERTEDLFLVSLDDKFPLDNQKKLARLEQKLTTELTKMK